MPIRVLASVIHRDGRLLICKRPDHKRHGALWEFPGGKVEPDETDFEAVSRELREELDVAVQAVGPVTFSMTDPGSEFRIEFLSVEIEGDPECREHSDIAWVRPQELGRYPLAPSDQRFAEQHLNAPEPI